MSESSPCARCGQHRDANIHLAQYQYHGHHAYVGHDVNPFMGAPLAPECNEWRHVFQGVDCCCDHGRLCACHVAVAPPEDHDAHVLAWACYLPGWSDATLAKPAPVCYNGSRLQETRMNILQLIEVLARIARERGDIPVCLGGVDSDLIPVSSVDFVDEDLGKVVLRA